MNFLLLKKYNVPPPLLMGVNKRTRQMQFLLLLRCIARVCPGNQDHGIQIFFRQSEAGI